MANRIRGEIAVTLDGASWTLCLTLGALAMLEKELDADGLSGLSAKFAKGNLTASDLIAILHAGLIGGGYDVGREEVAAMRVDGGASAYVEIAADLLNATFKPIAESDEISR